MCTQNNPVLWKLTKREYDESKINRFGVRATWHAVKVELERVVVALCFEMIGYESHGSFVWNWKFGILIHGVVRVKILLVS